jgi:hypothetical protein
MDRIKRIRKNSDFTQIDNSVFRSGLSLKAIGLLTYILHYPADWIIYKKNLIRDLKSDGRASFDSAWKELEQAGYIISEKVYCDEKKRPVWDYQVSETPCCPRNADFQHSEKSVENQHFTKNDKKGNACFRQSETRSSENQHLTNTISNTYTDVNNIASTTVDAAQKSVKPGKAKKERIKKVRHPVDTDTPRAANEAPPAPAKAIFQQVIDMYYTWHKEREGIPPKIDGAQGNAAKALAAYLRTVVRDRAREDKRVLDEAGEDEQIMKAWKIVLDNYGKVDGFYQDRIRLIDFNSNIQNILKQLKDGIAKKQQGNGAKKIDRGGLETALSVVAGRFGKGGNGNPGN